MRWWEGVAPLEVPGPDEAPDDHTFAWADGQLTLGAHPDPDADRALGALGGERCPCLDVLEAWEATHDDGAILTVGARGPADLVRPAVEAVLELRADLRRWRATSGSLVEEARLSRDTAAIDRLAAVAGPAERVAARRLGFLLLLGLDRRLLHRLQASVAAGFVDRPDRAPALQVATTARAAPALRAAGLTPDDLTLPADWLPTVWGRGLEVAVPGAVVHRVTSVTDDGRFEVVATAAGKSEVVAVVAPVGE